MATVQHRIGVIFALFFLLLALAAARTLYLGTVRAGTLRKAAQTQQLTNETLPAQRGTITDRNGVDLAVSEPAQDIAADPYLVKEPLQAAQKLAPLLGQPQAQILAKLSERRGFVYLARALPARQARAVSALKLEGISGTPVMRRVYPRGTLAAQVLGFVGTEGKGLSGLEYSQSSLLQGHGGGATHGQRRARPADLDRQRPHRETRRHAHTDARRQHPAARRRRPRRGRTRVRPQRRHRDRDEPQHRRAARGRQLATGERQRPRRLLAGGARRPRGRLRLRTGLHLQGVHRLGRIAAGPDHPDQRLQRPQPDPGRRPHDPRRHRTRRRDALDRGNPRPVQQRRGDRDRQTARARRTSTPGSTASASAHPPAWNSPARNRV